MQIRIALMMCALSFFNWAADAGETTVNPIEPGKTQLQPTLKAKVSAPLKDIAPKLNESGHKKHFAYPLRRRSILPDVNSSLSLNGTPATPTALQQKKVVINPAPAPLQSFSGISSADNTDVFSSSGYPSDPNGDVGPSHYVQMVNSLFRVYNKQGNPLSQPTALSSLFQSAGDNSVCAHNDPGDPIVLYDHLADRWLLSQFNFDTDISDNPTAPFYECIAISTTSDPTGSYYVYAIPTAANIFPDYPKLGVWPNGYYMTVNQFDDANASSSAIYVFDRAKMLAGDGSATTRYNYHDYSSDPTLGLLLPADLDGPAPLQATDNYVVGFDNNPLTGNPTPTLRLFRVHPDFSPGANGTSQEAPPITLAPFNPVVCKTKEGQCVRQRRSSLKLDALFDRPMHRLQYRYFATCPVSSTNAACGTLVFNHTVRAAANRAGVRWYLLKDDVSGISIVQQGTFSPDKHSRWLASVALNKQGDLGAGYSISSSSLYPSIRYGGRLVTDPVNTLSLEGTLVNSLDSQKGKIKNGDGRWGDYSMLAVDPSDDCTFWYTNQYYANPGDGKNADWSTRIGSFKLRDCTP